MKIFTFNTFNDATYGLPTTNQIPYRAALAYSIGYLIGKITTSSPFLCATVIATTTVVDSIFFLWISHSLKEQQEKLATYAFTHAFVEAIDIIALRQLKLISTKGTLIYTVFIISHFILFTLTAKSNPFLNGYIDKS